MTKVKEFKRLPLELNNQGYRVSRQGQLCLAVCSGESQILLISFLMKLPIGIRQVIFHQAVKTLWLSYFTQALVVTSLLSVVKQD
ncbi:MAG: hypothetical protein WBA93_03810 [Microcoleaceae cyanobacterium]